MRKWHAVLGLVVALAVMGWVAWLIRSDQIGDRSAMYARYERVRLGSQLPDVEAEIGMSHGPIAYDHTNVPELVECEDAYSVPGSFTNYYPGRRYVLLVQYDPITQEVTGKGMLRASRSTQWAERLAQGLWP